MKRCVGTQAGRVYSAVHKAWSVRMYGGIGGTSQRVYTLCIEQKEDRRGWSWLGSCRVANVTVFIVVVSFDCCAFHSRRRRET